MSKKTSKALALFLTAAMLLGGCGTTTTEEKPSADAETKTEEPKTETKQEETKEEKKEEKKESNAITDLVLSNNVVNEMETFNMLYSQSQKEGDVLTNLVDGLLEADNKGKMVPCISTEWSTEDGGLTWTFKLRDDVKWVDVNGNEKAVCNAQDFLTGLEWVMNAHKNEASNTSMPSELIEGAAEYYAYTKELTEEEAYALTAGEGSKFLDMVGIEAPDDYTLIYHCKGKKPYFDTVATYSCLYPMAQGMVDELGVAGVKAMDNKSMWYNGAYTMVDYVQGNEKRYEPNPLYWDTECTRFNSVTIKMVESNDVAYQLYETGEIDEIDLSESNLKTIYDNKDHKFNNYLVEKMPTKYDWQIHFNFDKRNDDATPDTNWNTAVANEAFRRSWYYGLDLKQYYPRINMINPMVCENDAYTMAGLCYTSDGTDYVDLVRDRLNLPERNGETLARLDSTKFEELKAQAIEELTAAGVTFPIMVDYYIPSGNQVSLDSANVFKQTIKDSLGDDYVQLNICTYVSSASKEVYKPQKHSICVNGWGADYGDPMNYLGQEIMGNENAYYSVQYSYIDKVEENENTKALLETYREYTRLVEEADKITEDLDARYNAFADAEAYFINHSLVIPHYYDVRWSLTKVNPYSKMRVMYGGVNNKMKNWETNADGYTTEEMAAIKAEYEAK